jgi:hypothetical protein
VRKDLRAEAQDIVARQEALDQQIAVSLVVRAESFQPFIEPVRLEPAQPVRRIAQRQAVGRKMRESLFFEGAHGGGGCPSSHPRATTSDSHKIYYGTFGIGVPGNPSD